MTLAGAASPPRRRDDREESRQDVACTDSFGDTKDVARQTIYRGNGYLEGEPGLPLLPAPREQNLPSGLRPPGRHRPRRPGPSRPLRQAASVSIGCWPTASDRRRPPGRKWRLDRVLRVLLHGHLAGIERLYPFEDIETEPPRCIQQGVERLRGVNTLYRDLRRFDSDDLLRCLQGVGREIVVEALARQQRVVLDFDPTVEILYGHQEGAERSSNPEKPGRVSDHPLLARDRIRDLVVNHELRPGSAAASTDILPFVHKTLDVVKESEPKKEILARMEAAFETDPLFSALERRGVGYAVKMRATLDLSAYVTSFAPQAWRRLDFDGEAEIQAASFCSQRPSACQRSRRVLVHPQAGDGSDPGPAVRRVWLVLQRLRDRPGRGARRRRARGRRSRERLLDRPRPGCELRRQCRRPRPEDPGSESSRPLSGSGFAAHDALPRDDPCGAATCAWQDGSSADPVAGSCGLPRTAPLTLHSSTCRYEPDRRGIEPQIRSTRLAKGGGAVRAHSISDIWSVTRTGSSTHRERHDEPCED